METNYEEDFNQFMDEVENQNQTEFNMSIDTLQRMSFCLWNMNYYSSHMELNKWRDWCEVLKREMAVFIQDFKDGAERINQLEYIRAQVNYFQIRLNNITNIGESSPVVRSKLIEWLDKYDVYLRRQMSDFGALIKRSRDPIMDILEQGMR